MEAPPKISKTTAGKDDTKRKSSPAEPGESEKKVNPKRSKVTSEKQPQTASVADDQPESAETGQTVSIEKEPNLNKIRAGNLGQVPVDLILSEEYWIPHTQYVFLPVNQGDYERLMKYVDLFSSRVTVYPEDLHNIDDKRFWFESYPINFKIIPFRLEKIKEPFWRYLILAVFPFSQPPDQLIRSAIENIFRELDKTLRPESPKNLSVLLTPHFSNFEKEKVAAILNTLKQITTSSSFAITLSEIIFITVADDFIKYIFGYFNIKSQPLEGDIVSEIDRLNYENEASSLADVLSLREMMPPISLAVMGGWGSGKSSVMRLIQKRMRSIRSEGLAIDQTWPDRDNNNKDKLSPFAGHIYLVELNAWDYAKSNLWASLMYRIFFCLNDQMVKERLIAGFLSENKNDPENVVDGYLRESPLWEALPMKEKDLKILIEKHLDPENQIKLNNLRHQEETRNYLWKSLKDSKRQLQEELAKTRKEIESQKSKLMESQMELDSLVEKEVTTIATMSQLILPVRNKFISLLGDIGNDFFKKVDDLVLNLNDKPKEEIDLKKVFDFSFFKKLKFNRTEWIGFVIFTAISAGIPFLAEWNTGKLPGIIIGILTLTGGLIRNYMKFRSTLETCYDEYISQLEKVRNELKIDRDVIKQKIIKNREARQDVDKQTDPILNLAADETKLAELVSLEKRQKELVGITADYETLTEFLKARLTDGNYEKELGLMHQVKKDLEYLTDGLRDRQDLFPRGPARIVLFIDDLDRCPPQRVVEVLEATQLLLRTELFVVVLAIDVRYIVKALEKHYEKILVRGGRPSALDYIEKIIQIPYRVRSIDPGTMSSYLRWQMAVEQQTTEISTDPEKTEEKRKTVQPAGEAQQDANAVMNKKTVFSMQEIKFTREEAEAWEECCKQVRELTPREVKRLVNVAKILKLVWYREGSQPELEVQKAVYLLLALSERFPDIMRDTLNDMSQKISAKDDTESLKDFIINHQLLKPDPFLTKEKALLNQIVSTGNLIDDDFKMSAVDLKTLDLVRCFCFVGDVGYDPGDEAPAVQK